MAKECKRLNLEESDYAGRTASHGAFGSFQTDLEYCNSGY